MTNQIAPQRTSDASLKVAKLDVLVGLLQRPEGADMTAMTEATGWLPHSVRGAMAGALRKKGHCVTSEKVDGRRVWRIASAGAV